MMREDQNEHDNEAVATKGTAVETHRGQRRGDGEVPPDRGPDDGNRPLRKPKKWYRRPVLVGLLIAVVIALAVGGALLWRHSRNYVSTDDAFIDIAAQRVSPQIAGRVLRVLVNDNQDVRAGQVLVELDPADFQNRIEQARAGVSQAEAQLAEAEAQRAVIAAQREQAQAGEGVAGATATNAAADLKRFRQMRATNESTVTPQQLDRAEADAKSTAAQLQAAQKTTAAAAAQLAHAGKQIEAARAAVRSAAAQLALAELTLSYTQVKASTDGRVARKTVAAGNYVQPGSDLMAIVPHLVFVTANFKETQLRHMRRGQPVKIAVDAYPEFELTGRVDSIQPATGQAFDILPAQNAAGNWVKVVQRVPVKIVFDQIPDDPERWLAPGMSVKARVSIR
jgi:membrane fusion protein (multidrug efflux system)